MRSVLMTTQIADWKHKISKSVLVRNTISMMAGGAVRMGLQGAYFVMIARVLGPSQYGAFVGVAVLIGVLSPFAMLGTGNLMIQNVARDRTTFRASWGNALCVTGILSGLLLTIILLTSRFLLSREIPLLLVVLVGFADLFLAGVVTLAGQAYQAFEQLHRTSRLNVVVTATRAAAALFLVVFVRHPDARIWSVFYFLSTAVAAVYAFDCVQRNLGSPVPALDLLRPQIREGFYFSFSLSSQSIYNNIDKPMLARFSTLDAVGIYATAYRLIDLAFQPVGALLASTYSRFFQHGARGLEGTTVFAKRLLPFSVTYGIFAGVGLVAAAPILPRILGENYATAVEALRWLSPLVLLKSIHYFLADSLTGAGFQGHRTGVQLLIGVQNVLLNLWLIPAYGWRGAAWSSLESDGMLAVGLALTILVLSRRAKTSQVGCRIEPGLAP
jgi:O-antigen/teichoic acid export membrane protein